MGSERAGSVSVIWRDRGIGMGDSAKAELERLVRELVALGATRVVLFGSHARGDAGPHSDIDLLALMPSPPPGPFPRRLASIYEQLCPRVGLDLLVYTPDELDSLKRERDFIREALEEGEVLYGDELLA